MYYSADNKEMDMAKDKPNKEQIEAVNEEFREFLLDEVVRKGRTLTSVYREDIKNNRRWGAKFGEPLTESGARYHLRMAKQAAGLAPKVSVRSAVYPSTPGQLNPEQKLVQIKAALDMPVDSETIVQFIKTILSKA